MNNSARAFTAPGKAFLAGGYLVLEPIYNAYVTALSSRMHAIVKISKSSELLSSTITISSPQFLMGEWKYEIDNDDLVKIPTEVNQRNNPFLEATVFTVLSYIQPKEKFDLKITIFSDPGYHSQDDTTAKLSDNKSKKFLYHSKAINDVAKTGLGSSAGLVAVVTTVLISAFKDGSISDLQNIIHNCAQIAHCYAQKKIGSGFDVATAVYGSIIYRRFDPRLINELFQHGFFNSPNDKELKQSYSSALTDLVESKWEFNSIRCTLPPGIRLLMGDIKGGSETPKLVSKVLKWKSENVLQSCELYERLNQANLDFIDALSELHRFYVETPATYKESLAYLLSTNVVDLSKEESTTQQTDPKLIPFVSLIEAIKRIRSNLRDLTAYSGAEIEPKSQTVLLDNCNELNGCLGGMVPGAGGFDAICLLVIEDSINEFVDSTKENIKFENVAWLNLHEEDDGIVEEQVTDYSGLL
mmetsp:Transcript_5587/g.6585  ORF Transcript_5587/g.6585 Transcript_5587/m.6585 type:complete len:470 (-) Transcript_5587:1768-3177(-)